MPRHSLGSDKPDGESTVIRCKVPESLAESAKETLDGKETLSDLMRESLRREIKRREKRKVRSQ